MITIFVPDDLRAGVEASTGGQVTVLYTEQNSPSCFFVLPKFNLEDIDASLGSGPHPAFIINGQEVSRLFIGQHTALNLGRGELLSIPNVAPSGMMSLPAAVQAARDCGPGFHIMTNAEWAAVALWCQKNNWLPGGNTSFGRHSYALYETGVRVDGMAPGAVEGNAITYTGSGPASWRHNNQPDGIADLVGNITEWVTGVRLVEGELQVFPNNDAAAYTGIFANATNWKAIDLATGALVNPGTAGSIKADSLAAPSQNPPQNAGNFAWSATLVHKTGPSGDIAGNHDYNKMAFPELTGPSILKALALAALNSPADGAAKIRNYGTRAAMRGGRYTSGEDAGIFNFDMSLNEAAVNNTIGARLAKY